MTDYTELKPLLEACRAENCDGPREFRKAVEALFDVCTVETISALIAENERLNGLLGEWDRSSLGLALIENTQLKAENKVLRKIISDSATSCGAAVSVECSLDFMGHLPVEIFSVISKLRNALAECADSLHGEMLQKFGGQPPDDMHPVTRREYDRDMAEVAGYRAAMGKGEQP